MPRRGFTRITLPGVIAASVFIASCSGRPEGRGARTRDEHPSGDRAVVYDSAARTREFTASMAGLLLDVDRFEMRGTLAVKRVNPDRDDESPLADSLVRSGAAPGPHVYEGTFYADLEVLHALLDPRGGARPKVEEDRVFVGSPEVLILGHHHGGALFVPVKLYARQFGAFVDVRGTLGTMAIIWTPEILQYAKRIGLVHSTGILQGYAEGLVDSVDVHARPGG